MTDSFVNIVKIRKYSDSFVENLKPNSKIIFEFVLWVPTHKTLKVIKLTSQSKDLTLLKMVKITSFMDSRVDYPKIILQKYFLVFSEHSLLGTVCIEN